MPCIYVRALTRMLCNWLARSTFLTLLQKPEISAGRAGQPGPPASVPAKQQQSSPFALTSAGRRDSHENLEDLAQLGAQEAEGEQSDGAEPMPLPQFVLRSGPR